MPDAVYTAEVTASGGGRDGRVRSSDGFIDQELKHPKGLGGPGGATNPEQLFAAGYSACFLGALQLAARNEKRKLPDGTTVTAQVGIFPHEISFAIDAVLTAYLPGLEQADAERLMETAHQVCPYSKATRGNVDVTLVAKT
jgi:lipoyl-dependent peroxiredoxin